MSDEEFDAVVWELWLRRPIDGIPEGDLRKQLALHARNVIRVLGSSLPAGAPVSPDDLAEKAK